MKDALETSLERTPDALDDMSPRAADPDHLTTDLVRKVMEKSSLQAGQTEGTKPKNLSAAQARMNEARNRRNANQAEDAARHGILRQFFGRLLGRLTKPVRSYQPKPLHFRIVTIALVFVISPWLIPILAALTLTICTITYLTLGPDRLTEIGVSFHARLEKISPQKAEALKCRWDSAVNCMERWASHLPEKWTADLFWQDDDVSEKMVDKMKVDPFDKLATQARNT